MPPSIVEDAQQPVDGAELIGPSSESTMLEHDLLLLRRITSISVIVALIAATWWSVSWYLNAAESGLFGPPSSLVNAEEDYDEMVQLNNVGNLEGKGVNVCIVDSGIDAGHREFINTDFGSWKDFVNGKAEPYDDHGHGTMMAGILVADTEFKGVAPSVTLHVAKALDSDGNGTGTRVAEAIDWCVGEQSDVISLSLGGAPGIIPSQFSGDETATAVNNAIAQGVFVIAAAGNDGGEETDDDVEAPCNERDVICVGGVDKDGDSWRYSSRGDNNGRLNPPLFPRFNPDKKPEVVAPAEDVPVALPGNSWGTASGTSAATVYLTGAISLLLEGRKDMQREGSAGGEDAIRSVKEWIMDSSKPKNGQSEHDDRYGYGMLQTRAFLDLAGVSID